jgi:hypothetical protein
VTKELLIALVDLVVILVSYFAAQFLAPEWQEHVKVILVALQPFVLALIAHFYADRLAAGIAAKLR